MKIAEVRGIAESQHIDPADLSKTKLIKSIQINEGNFDCYATAYAGECDQLGCNWREDCFESARTGEPS